MISVSYGLCRSMVYKPSLPRCTVIPRAYLEPRSTLFNKTLLRELCGESDRGIEATQSVQGQIAETQVSLESASGDFIDYDLLAGKWRLIYTNARDVLPILFLGRSPFRENIVGLPWPIKVGAIYQEFSLLSEGKIKNIIKIGFNNVFEDEGITFTVIAKYEKRGPKRIVLDFQKVEISDLEISPLVESILAPAFLPRTGFNHQILLAIKEFSLSVPAPRPRRRAETAGYLLTYLDEDLLIGRPLDQGGTFIFNRETP